MLQFCRACSIATRMAAPQMLSQELKQLPADEARRQKRWNTASELLHSTTTERRRFDHRAHMANLVGVYVAEQVTGSQSTEVETELLVAMQPDQGGRKMLFLDKKGQTLGVIELETLLEGSEQRSVLRGMLVAEEVRGQGYARLFLSMWLGLCARAGIMPETARINKPLLALTLVRLGFTPLRGRTRLGLRGKPGRRRKANQRPLAVEVSVGSHGDVLLYCPLPSEAERLRLGFSQTEVRSQRLVIANQPPLPRGRVAHIRVRYAPPRYRASGSETDDRSESTPAAAFPMVHTPLAEAANLQGRLRLCASQGPVRGVQSAALQAELQRVLTGPLVAS